MKHRPLGRNHRFQSLPFLILLGASAKFLVDTSVQFYNPFLMLVATGVGIGAVAMGRIVALRNLMGLFAPFLGNLADRIGHRKVMRASLLTIGAAMILAPLTGSVLVFALAVILTGLGQGGYTPNLHAYLSSKLPYDKRALGLGITEYSWALAGIIGLLVSGFLIEAFSWKTPYYVIGVGLIMMSFVFKLLPDEDQLGKAQNRTERNSVPFWHKVRNFASLGANARSAWAAIILSGLNMFAMMHIMIIHGGWLGSEYGLSPSRLGKIAMILGMADLVASVLVSLAVDRIGKKRSVTIGVIGMVVGYAVLPLLNLSLGLAVASIVIPRMSFEFAVVSNFPLLSEQAPKSRGKVMSLGMTAGLLGATIASLTGPTAYIKYGVMGLGWVSGAVAAVSLVVLILFVKEPLETHGDEGK